MSLRVIGLDLSLTATGVAWIDGRADTLRSTRTGVLRLDDIRNLVFAGIQVATATKWEWVEIVALEDYAYHGRLAHSHELGELGGVIRLALWENGIPFIAVNPTSLKRYATGRGNAGKEEVLAAAIRRLGYGGHDHNQADALWLRAMTLDHYGQPPVAMPTAHRQALDKVAWPDLTERGAA